MIKSLNKPDLGQSHRLRLNTLVRLRWLAIVGQSVTVLAVAYWLDFSLPVSLCFALIACSAWLNLVLAFRYPATHRLQPGAAFGILMFDALQLAGLLYMTGGLTNPPTAITQILEQLVRVTAGLSIAYFLLPRGVEYAAIGTTSANLPV